MSDLSIEKIEKLKQAEDDRLSERLRKGDLDGIRVRDGFMYQQLSRIPVEQRKRMILERIQNQTE